MSLNIEEHVQEAVEYLLQEYSYFQEFKKDLEELSAQIEHWKQGKVLSYKKLFQDSKYIGKAERRFNRFLIKVEEDFKRLLRQGKKTKSREELERLEQHLEIGGRMILAAASLHEGRIKQELEELYELDVTHEGGFIEKDGIRTIFTKHLDLLQEQVDRAVQWIASLSNDLEKARELVHEATEGIGPYRWEWLPSQQDEILTKKYNFQVFVYDFSIWIFDVSYIELYPGLSTLILVSNGHKPIYTPSFSFLILSGHFGCPGKDATIAASV